MNMRDFQKKSFLIKQEIIIEDDGKKSRSNLEIILPLAVFLLAGFGVLIIYSATRYSMPEGVSDPMYYFKRQGYWLIGAAVMFILLQFMNYRSLWKFWWVFLVISALILAAVSIFGYEVNYSKSWIDLKLFSAQPSELSKILLVLVTAAILSKWPREKVESVSFKKVAFSLLAAIVPIVLILLEPDYGTALIFFATYMGMLFISGANLFYFFGILAVTVGGFFTAVKTGLIKQYQLDRILVFLKPEIEKQGIGYNLFQSKLAIGSGGLWGKGLFLGKQTNLSYVPEHHTDFIFSVIGEEVGFFGAVLVIAVIAIIIWRCFHIALRAGNNFGKLIAAGIGFIILTQSVINIGMTIGIMPVIGIPLPFVSYGGSNLLAIFLGVALVENVYLRRELRTDYEIAYDDFD
ncbi:MAG: Rod shape-determining protein RodA [Actinobacteria bacterium ADurb.Bin346]|nr:MAG: Rod shape-determining protein RodA [Actinobacteria bacterium ADurb.Bin346]